jgi:hypothetical protein
MLTWAMGVAVDQVLGIKGFKAGVGSHRIDIGKRRFSAFAGLALKAHLTCLLQTHRE